jgi:hypothetical protein
VHLIGAAVIAPPLLPLPDAELMQPQYRPVRMAFSMYDRICTGEIDPWQCFLCARPFSGLERLSVLAFIEGTLGEPARSKPAIVSPICQACDSVSTEHTLQRVRRAFGLMPLQGGHA